MLKICRRHKILLGFEVHQVSGDNFLPSKNLTLMSNYQHQEAELQSAIRCLKKTNIVLNLVQQIRKYSRYSASTIMTPHCKEFSFSNYDLIGFDLDGTLLRYNLNEMLPLEYNLLISFLVEQKGYPRVLLEKQLDKDFMQKGLVLDNDRGNIMKLSSDATILRATHGTTLLTRDEIELIYGPKRQWPIARQFFENPLSTWNGPLSERLRTLLDYFDMAVSVVFGQAIDVLDSEAKSKGSSPPTVYNVWPDILEGLILIYTRENFSNGKSGYFNALRAEPERYLLRTHECIVRMLRDLRANGKAVFLLTGSNIDFANFTASFALGKNWQELFDSVICFAKKPGFFTMQRPYLHVQNCAELPGSEINVAVELSLNTAYTQGNWHQLRDTLSKSIGKSSNKVRSLYVGDNLIQDVYTPVKHHDMDAVALCEELLADVGVKHMPDYPFQEVISSKFWGSYFSLDNEPTLWSTIIAKYSQLCIPLIDNLAQAPITHRYLCENADGYYPKAPEVNIP